MTRKSSRKSKSPAEAATAIPSRPPVRLVLGLILAVYFLLALGPAFFVPWEWSPEPRLVPPDEPAHWEFVRDLATGQGLPVFTSGEGNYEAHQPPLYYASVVWTWWVAGQDAVPLARLWGALLGGLALLAAWKATWYLLGDRPWTRLAAVGALAFIPGRLFIMASVSNDPMFDLLSAVVLWLVLRGVAEGLVPRQAAVLGVCLGLALLTKTSALVLCPVVALGGLMEPTWRREGFRCLAANAGVIVLAVAALWGWWVARNMALYGEPLALNVFQELFLKDRATPEFFLDLGMSWTGYWMLVGYQWWLSLWGVFGQATVYMPTPYYQVGTLLGALAALGLLARAVRAWLVARDQADAESPAEEPSRTGTYCWVLAVFLFLLVTATFLQFNTVFYQAQARYFFGAGVVMTTILAAGITGLSRKEDSPLPALGLMVIVAALAVWAIAAHATGGYHFTPPVVR